MDKDLRKVTIISQVPFALRETKPCYPSDYVIPAAPWKDISTLIIEPAHCFVYIDSNRGSMPMPLLDMDLARSIIDDFCVSVLAYSEDAKPALFYEAGDWTNEEVKKKFSSKISKYRAYQINWFKALVRIADNDWAQTRQPRSISDLQRSAAKFLEVDKAWLDIIPEEQKQCPACYHVVDPRAVICYNCNCVLDMKKYEDMSFAGTRTPNPKPMTMSKAHA